MKFHHSSIKQNTIGRRTTASTNNFTSHIVTYFSRSLLIFSYFFLSRNTVARDLLSLSLLTVSNHSGVEECYVAIISLRELNTNCKRVRRVRKRHIWTKSQPGEVGMWYYFERVVPLLLSLALLHEYLLR